MRADGAALSAGSPAGKGQTAADLNLAPVSASNMLLQFTLQGVSSQEAGIDPSEHVQC